LKRNLFHLNDYFFQLIIIFILAFATSLFFNFFIIGVEAIPAADAKDYILIARSLVEHGSWPFFGRPPLFPIILAILFKFGLGLFQVRIFLSLVGALTCVLVALIAKEIFKNQKTAWAAGLIAAVYPMLYYWNGFLLTETVNTFMVTAATLMVVTFLEQRKAVYLALAGIFFGLAALTRPEGLFISGFVILWLLLEKDLRPQFLKYFTSFTIALLLVVVPWIVFVSLKVGTFVPIKTGGGYTFIGANNSEILKGPFGAWGGHIDPFDAGIVSQKEVEGLSEVERDRLFFRITMDYISKNPGEVAVLLFWKVVNLFRVHPSAYSSWSLKLMAFSSYLVVFILSVFGILRYSLKNEETRFLLAIILAYVANALIFLGDTRFRNAIEPALLIFAIYGFKDIVARFGFNQEGI
jgi:4-amino-4-deoxy-L-arabinose transferase-like glycosyltransferase